MSQAVADQLFLAYMGRPADTQWRSATSTLTDAMNNQPTAALQTAFYNAAVAEGVFSATDSPSTLVNKIFLQQFGFAASAFEQTAWGNLIANGTISVAGAAWTIFASYLGATNVPAAYQQPAQSKLLAIASFSNALTDPTINAAYSQLNSSAAVAGRAFLAPITSQATAAPAITSVATTVAGLNVNTGSTFTLTTGIDAVVGTVGNDTINALLSTAAGVSTFSALDSIDGGTGIDTLNVNDVIGASAFPASATVKNVEIANLTSAGTLAAVNTSGWTGLTTLNATSLAGQAGVTAATTTAVTSKDTALAAGTISVSGGSSVSVAASGVTTGSITAGSATTAGAIVVTDTVAAAGGVSLGTIATNGGTTVSVTENLTGAVNTTAVGGAVTVNGGAATTTVTVTQTAAATAAAAVIGVAGVNAVTAVTAAPGVQGVTAVTAATFAAAKAGVAGVTDGAVTVQDAAYNTIGANTITTVTLNNYGNSTINDNALANLSLSGKSGTLAITNATSGGGATPTANTTLNLSVNGLTGTNTITDTNNEITTLNVTTGATASTLAAFADTGLKTVNVSGASALTLTATPGTMTALNVSGAAGYSDAATTAAGGLAARAAALTITNSSTGTFTAAIDDLTQTYTATGAGTSVITVSSTANATKTTTAGAGTTDKLVLEGGAYALTSGAKFVGFEQLAVAANATGTIDMSVLGASMNLLQTLGNNSNTFTKVATGAALTTNASSTAVSVQYVDTTGTTDVTTLTIGAATNAAVITATSLTFMDANNVGVGTLNIVSNDVTFNDANVITTLVDNGLSTLNVSGTAGLNINTLNEATTQATSVTLNNTSTGAAGLTIGAFTDNSLGNLKFAGTGPTVVTAMTDTGNVISISNTGTGSASIGTLTAANVNSFTIGAGVSLGQAATAATNNGLQAATTVGVTVAGGADNNHVTVNLTAGAAAGNTDTITLGNGNDVVVDGSTAGTVNVTVGTGSNLIQVASAAAGNNTFAANITLGAHTAATGIDSIFVSARGTNTGANTVITGAVTGDKITFTDTATAGPVTTQNLNANTYTSVAAGIAAAGAVTAAGGAATFLFGGNTYVVETVAAATLAATSTVIQLVGVHTLSTESAGVVTLLT